MSVLLNLWCLKTVIFMKFSEILWNSQKCTKILRNSQKCTKIHRNVLKFTEFDWIWLSLTVVDWVWPWLTVAVVVSAVVVVGFGRGCGRWWYRQWCVVPAVVCGVPAVVCGVLSVVSEPGRWSRCTHCTTASPRTHYPGCHHYHHCRMHHSMLTLRHRSRFTRLLLVTKK